MSATKTINVSEIADARLVSTRNFADILIELAESMDADTVIFDFENIESVTRSFFDQLNARIAESKIDFEFENLNSNLINMLKLVRQRN